MKRVLRLATFGLVTLTIALAVTFAGLCYQEARYIVSPNDSTASNTPVDYGLTTYQDVTLTTSDGLELDGWYVPPTRDDGATVLFIHGHAGNRAQLLRQSAMFAERGYGLFFIDVRNHGTSEGSVTTMGVLEVLDVQAVFDFLVQQPEVNPERIAFFGHSMGGATAIQAFRHIPQAWLVISDSSFASLDSLLYDRIPRDTGIPPLIFPQIIIGFSNSLSGSNLYEANPLEDIQHLNSRPVFISHGTNDRVVPFSQGQRLFDAASEPKEFFVVEGAGHGGAMVAAEFDVRVMAFVERFLE